ncbi:MAG TPA: PhoH family protein [Hungateiclostridium thermocellum]|uniref:PhoH-like protein n=1 Tax=Acetivibrio thermocellus (strain ATCC 27405 / DSM 1237 / JCM 9322 / NBRC 103400 / NCIMB 10682 / NRRL B-4536 / VPI 7372) TaxID=203119 RepID=A3DEC4_ACET2|nr:PhoH family protein [Acetivibrio thermocellus]ABN52303.1 PhoH family protein [Acetivibrio thermocellus ATCC 27405]HBW26157.1 PhoH family protein [Acetivibrio thermocellus]
MESLVEVSLEFDRIEHAMNLFGNFDENINIIEDAFNVKIISRDNEIRVVGYSDAVYKAQTVLQRLIAMAAQGDIISKQNVSYFVQLAEENQLDKIKGFTADFVCLTARGRQIKAKTHGQKVYVDAIKENDIVFGIGPAGTGKTFLAVAMAVNAFRNKKVNRIVLTRPAVEAGEKLGFLPGDLQNKVDPYLRPLYDALYEMMGAETYHKYLEKGMIEVAPLAYMRGRTLDDSFIILDEAQNTTPEQMKMFLTRIGFGSKAVITGDITQIDLPGEKKSGLVEVMKVLKDVKGISFVHLSDMDVVRHELVQRIIQAYERYDREKKEKGKKESKETN